MGVDFGFPKQKHMLKDHCCLKKIKLKVSPMTHQQTRRYCQYFYCDGNHQRKENKKQNSGAKPGKYLKLALTNSTNNKIKQDNLSFTNQTKKEERFSREVSQMQSDISNVLRKFS